jgi:hypothetical protein
MLGHVSRIRPEAPVQVQLVGNMPRLRSSYEGTSTSVAPVGIAESLVASIVSAVGLYVILACAEARERSAVDEVV